MLKKSFNYLLIMSALGNYYNIVYFFNKLHIQFACFEAEYGFHNRFLLIITKIISFQADIIDEY